MIIVADSSPFIGLLKIGHVEILPQIYGTVIIPTDVANELASPNRPQGIQLFIKQCPAWLSIRIPAAIEAIPDLDRGERAAISLARELSADFLLIDENKGRQEALTRNAEAANRGLLNLQNTFDKLRATNFRVPPKALDELLKKHNEFMLTLPIPKTEKPDSH